MTPHRSRLNSILIVEDDESMRELAAAVLKAANQYEIHTFGTAEEALNAAPDINPDLALVDAVLPGISGSQFVKQLRAMPGLAGVPVVYITARSGPNAQADLDITNPLGIIAKPFDPMALADTLETLWRQATG